ncbi:hypothetical protein LX36DRAFT_728876 [Colletotrichum falcatum]|nr:hypothetical protein LX36DRAFT_728876 [Colletotrichum falcatum]
MTWVKGQGSSTGRSDNGGWWRGWLDKGGASSRKKACGSGRGQRRWQDQGAADRVLEQDGFGCKRRRRRRRRGQKTGEGTRRKGQGEKAKRGRLGELGRPAEEVGAKKKKEAAEAEAEAETEACEGKRMEVQVQKSRCNAMGAEQRRAAEREARS